MARQSSPQLYLSPDQQDLLMAALSSNQSAAAGQKSTNTARKSSADKTRSGSGSLSKSDAGKADQFDTTYAASSVGPLEYSPDDNGYLDFDFDAEGDENFDYDGNLIGDYDDHTPHDLHEKRKSLEGKDDDDEGGGKRREGEDKSGKKPGRKPLTSEPTTKRKAQNRAAQRAFRERKEKHLKDLETKVEDLEKTSESTNHENGLLRAQVERLQIELKEYRKRLSWVSNSGLSRSPQNGSSFASQARGGNALNNNDFQFEFPKFGDLPAAIPSLTNGTTQKQQNTAPARSSTLPTKANNQQSPASLARSSFSGSSPRAPAPNFGSTGNSPMTNGLSASPATRPFQVPEPQNSIDSLSGLFSPSILEASRNSAFGYFPQTTANANQGPRYSFDNGLTGSMATVYSSSNTDSPASSSDSHQPSSSIGTSPEPSLNSPGSKLHEFGLNTIKEEGQNVNTFGGATFTPGFDSNSINWLAQQNGGGFDPTLFGDYRESQDAVVSQDFGSFFNEAFPLPDLGSPLHNFNDIAPEPTPKFDLLKQVEAAKEGDEEVVPAEDTSKLMSCNKIWDRLQSMEKFRNGEIDVDNLCSELRAKARCSEGGAVVEERDVDKILGGAN